ncbi:MAG: hypothetical protein OEZ54_10930, partial [Gemmatimonadota bacterium]|nr:hypothetical protein [Gemmatimonadota bacterium]
MSDKVRLAVGGSLLIVGGAIVAVLAVKKPQPPLDSSLAPAFEIMGTPIQALNHLVTRVMPVDALDEAQLGNVISRHYEATTDTTGVDFRYVNEILDGL